MKEKPDFVYLCGSKNTEVAEKTFDAYTAYHQMRFDIGISSDDYQAVLNRLQEKKIEETVRGYMPQLAGYLPDLVHLRTVSGSRNNFFGTTIVTTGNSKYFLPKTEELYSFVPDWIPSDQQTQLDPNSPSFIGFNEIRSHGISGANLGKLSFTDSRLSNRELSLDFLLSRVDAELQAEGKPISKDLEEQIAQISQETSTQKDLLKVHHGRLLHQRITELREAIKTRLALPDIATFPDAKSSRLPKTISLGPFRDYSVTGDRFMTYKRHWYGTTCSIDKFLEEDFAIGDAEEIIQKLTHSLPKGIHDWLDPLSNKARVQVHHEVIQKYPWMFTDDFLNRFASGD